MAILLLSVPHTGTRFAMLFLDTIGVIYHRYHTGAEDMEEIAEHVNPGIVIPLRDPLLCWMSSYKDFDGNKNQSMTTLKSVKGFWECLDNCILEQEHIFLRLDTNDREAELAKVAEFCGASVPAENFTWEHIGSSEIVATQELWEESDYRYKPVVERELAPIREQYGYI